jgi:hypothetical protein
MKTKKSEFLKSFGKMWEIVKLIVNAVLDAGGSDEDMERLQKDPELVKKIVALIVNQAKSVASAFTVVVDYTKSLADMIKAGGYDWKNSDITADHFPVVGSGQAEVGLELVHYGKNMSTEDVLADLDKRSLRPATLAELLAFGAKYPDEQRKYPIIALGSVWADWGGDRYVAYLRESDRELKLNLGCHVSVWGDHCRFLAASK